MEENLQLTAQDSLKFQSFTAVRKYVTAAMHPKSLKCKSAAENASFHYPFDSKFKFYGAQLSKPCLWGSSKTNFINVHTQTSFAALVQTFKKTQGYQHPFILRCCTLPCIHILTIINKPSSPAIIMKQTFPHPMQILGWQKIPFSNLQGELSKEN